MNLSLSSVLVGTALMLVQLLLAIPWVLFLTISWAERQKLFRQSPANWALQPLLGGLVAAVVVPVLVLTFIRDRGSLEVLGRLYMAVFQLQMTLDAFILLFALLVAVWPKAGAVAQAAFLEGVRQPMFWLLTGLAALAMVVWIVLPYYTFGEDYLVVKQLGYDTIMLAAVLFGGLAASLSISEEIEGRAAITVMSKPVSRRQFMFGKFAGILLAAMFMFGMLGVLFEGVLLVKHWFDKLDPLTVVESQTTQVRIGVVPTPAWVIETLDRWALPAGITDVLRGMGQWTAHTLDTLPGLILCFSQVMVLVGLAVALATRVPMVVNLVTVLVVYLVSHLTPVLVAIAGRAQDAQPNSPVPRLLGFVARVFDTVLPDLGSFSMDPALLSDAAPPADLFARYVGAVTLYGFVYTAIVLLFGLILFEDRDLA